MFARVAISAVLIGVAAASAQQPQQEWFNDQLENKLPRDQYIAIGRGDLAQCEADSQATVDRAVSLYACSPEAGAQLGPIAGMQCGDAMNKRKQMYRDLFFGCMARKGWALRRKL